MRRVGRFPVVIGAVIAVMLVGASVALASETHLAAALSGSSSYPVVRGHAEYDRDGTHRDFHISLWNAGKLAGKTLTVYAGGQKVGTMCVSSTGTCQLHHDSEHSQYVPALSGGDAVRVRTGSGTLVASGTLRRVAHE